MMFGVYDAVIMICVCSVISVYTKMASMLKNREMNVEFENKFGF